MNRLILLEGLPGTGKTTNSYRLFEQMVRNGRDVRWLHEVSQPHPTLFFSESCLTKEEYRLFKKKYPEIAEMLDSIAEIRATTVGIDYLTASRRMPGQENEAWYQELLQYDVMAFPLERYERAAIEKWETFVNAALQKDTIYILDSSIFQYQIFTYLLSGADYPRLSQFVHSIMKLLEPLHPALIYLYREKTEDSITFMEKQRGMKDLESTWERDKERPYYQNKQQDVTAFFNFLEDYANWASRLYDELECDKLRIEITAQTWEVYEKEMLRFLGIAHQDAPSYKAKDGTFVNVAAGASFSIKDGILTDPEGVRRRLSAKSPTEFFMEGLPEILCFCDDETAKLCGQQIIPQWSETGLVYTRETEAGDSMMYSLVSQWYEEKQNVEEMRGWNPALKTWEREVIDHFPSGAKVLDIGCGLGREAFPLADLCYDVVGIDISKEVISQVRQLSEEKGYDIPFVVYDGKNLPFPDDSFDVVLIWAQTFGLLYGEAFRRDYLAECSRVLKSGGLFSFSAHDYDYLKTNYSHCLDGRKFYPYAGSEIYWEAFEIPELTQYARQAGFEVILCEKGSIYKPEDGTVLHCLCRKPQVDKDRQAENLILHFVTEDDLSEVARTWPADHHPLSDTEAREAIVYMIGNYKKNTKGCIYHLCLAVCRADDPHTIMGWCGLDGRRNHSEPEIFILLDEPYRGKGYGTLCVKELVRIAAEDYALPGVHGGCARENIASARAMEKGGMVRYGTEENGDPLFRFTAKKKTDKR